MVHSFSILTSIPLGLAALPALHLLSCFLMSSTVRGGCVGSSEGRALTDSRVVLVEPCIKGV